MHLARAAAVVLLTTIVCAAAGPGAGGCAAGKPPTTADATSTYPYGAVKVKVYANQDAGAPAVGSTCMSCVGTPVETRYLAVAPGGTCMTWAGAGGNMSVMPAVCGTTATLGETLRVREWGDCDCGTRRGVAAAPDRDALMVAGKCLVHSPSHCTFIENTDYQPCRDAPPPPPDASGSGSGSVDAGSADGSDSSASADGYGSSDGFVGVCPPVNLRNDRPFRVSYALGHVRGRAAISMRMVLRAGTSGWAAVGLGMPFGGQQMQGLDIIGVDLQERAAYDCDVMDRDFGQPRFDDASTATLARQELVGGYLEAEVYRLFDTGQPTSADIVLVDGGSYRLARSSGTGAFPFSGHGNTIDHRNIELVSINMCKELKDAIEEAAASGSGSADASGSADDGSGSNDDSGSAGSGSGSGSDGGSASGDSSSDSYGSASGSVDGSGSSDDSGSAGSGSGSDGGSASGDSYGSASGSGSVDGSGSGDGSYGSADGSGSGVDHGSAGGHGGSDSGSEAADGSGSAGGHGAGDTHGSGSGELSAAASGDGDGLDTVGLVLVLVMMLCGMGVVCGFLAFRKPGSGDDEEPLKEGDAAAKPSGPFRSPPPPMVPQGEMAVSEGYLPPPSLPTEPKEAPEPLYYEEPPAAAPLPPAAQAPPPPPPLPPKRQSLTVLMDSPSVMPTSPPAYMRSPPVGIYTSPKSPYATHSSPGSYASPIRGSPGHYKV